MSRINTNVSSLIAQHNLGKTNRDLSTSLERLSTGLQINRGADDPAGLIVSERLRSEIKGVGQAIDNSERAVNVIATAEAALQEISNLLTETKALQLWQREDLAQDLDEVTPSAIKEWEARSPKNLFLENHMVFGANFGGA